MKTITALAPWFGSNRSCAAEVGNLLRGCSWVGVPFAGGMCELLHITARTMLVSDLHAHVLNLAAVVADPELCDQLREGLDNLPVHPEILAGAQLRCRDLEPTAKHRTRPDLAWAVDYFVSAWMSRNGCAGTANEFKTGQSVRWTSGGGDSAVRFRNATAALADWSQVMRRCTFVSLDVFDFLDHVEDRDGYATYLDPPFPEVGASYKHGFSESEHRRLAARLAEFSACRVVCRFYDHPLIREVYPESRWTWHRPQGGKKQTNEAAPEVLLVSQRS